MFFFKYSFTDLCCRGFCSKHSGNGLREQLLFSGTLLKRISDDMVAKLENGTTEAQKMNLFGGHETNIAALLHTLGVWKPQIPEYASAVIVELITNEDGDYVRVSVELSSDLAIDLLWRS